MVTRRTAQALLCAALALAAAPAEAQPDEGRGKEAQGLDAPAENPKASDGPDAPAKDAQTKEAPTENARAENPPSKGERPLATPRLHHAPVSVTQAHEDLLLEAEIAHPELVRRALVVYRTPKDATLREVEFRRGLAEYVAPIPADHVQWPWVAYAIEIELLDGSRVPVFANRKNPYSVQVPEDLMDVRERALLERLGGRRSVVTASGEFVSFGSSETNEIDPTTGGLRRVDDYYYRLEAAYTYRPLRLVTEFSLRIGLLRGRSPVALDLEDEPQNPDDRFKVGLNYGAPTVRIRLADIWHVEGEFLTSVTEVGFSVGAGGALLVGDPYGSKLTLGFETIQVFGTRFYSRMDIPATQRLSIAPMIELTNMPHAGDSNYGVRLLGEAAFDVGRGFGVALRGGYQARLATSGGPSGGATLSYAF
jgi:hypothetical protein